MFVFISSKRITLKRKKNIEDLECDETWFYIFKLPKLEFNENVSEKLLKVYGEIK